MIQDPRCSSSAPLLLFLGARGHRAEEEILLRGRHTPGGAPPPPPPCAPLFGAWRLPSVSQIPLLADLVLQVHDEVLVEAPPEEQDVVGEVIVDALTNAAQLSVPLEVSLHWGDNWADAKG